MAADELGSRVNNDISAVLNRTDEVRGTESVVDYERQTVLVRNLCDSLDIRNIGIRVAESLDVNRLSIVLDGQFFSCASTKVVSTPNCGRVCASRL